jgi:low affinity Fe/Cu permease
MSLWGFKLKRFISRRRITLADRWDRIFLLVGCIIFGVFWWVVPPHLAVYWDLIIILSVSFGLWLFLYIIQDVPEDPFSGYTDAIQDIERISGQLSNLVEFLKQERAKVEESEATLSKLQSERRQLEPVVVAQRETVNAILSAHARVSASKIWKERALGFVSGLLASLLASLVFEYLKR